jgi:hypothetical protein
MAILAMRSFFYLRVVFDMVLAGLLATAWLAAITLSVRTIIAAQMTVNARRWWRATACSAGWSDETPAPSGGRPRSTERS